ncbi:hypothetical protein [Vibrio sp. D431a]|uniref:hypothetical protein n=1 Tax=Vibrio sp. D431a TaxID=2837388 RepID=UPI002553C340|nr:hypothetical protein [Vibrio sp. D431a]MDK9789901.1 hypothetical protein [Vibrio sp. D431a]
MVNKIKVGGHQFNRTAKFVYKTVGNRIVIGEKCKETHKQAVKFGVSLDGESIFAKPLKSTSSNGNLVTGYGTYGLTVFLAKEGAVYKRKIKPTVVMVANLLKEAECICRGLDTIKVGSYADSFTLFFTDEKGNSFYTLLSSDEANVSASSVEQLYTGLQRAVAANDNVRVESLIDAYVRDANKATAYWGSIKEVMEDKILSNHKLLLKAGLTFPDYNYPFDLYDIGNENPIASKINLFNVSVINGELIINTGAGAEL